MKETWQQLIKNRMKESNETQESISEKLNVSQGSIAHWLSGRRKPDTAIISSLMKAVGVDSIILKSDGSASTCSAPVKKENDYFTVDVLDIYASAGMGTVNMDVVEVVRSIQYNNEQATNLFGGRSQNHLKIINIKGDSMQGVFESGDLAFIDTSVKNFEGDGIYVFVYDRCLFVKRLQMTRENLLVISENKSYKVWKIPKSELDQVFIQGKVLLSQSMELRKHG